MHLVMSVRVCVPVCILEKCRTLWGELSRAVSACDLTLHALALAAEG